ncbi:polysaccharide biosynthesis protein [Nonlabens spongiae]|uniref:Polysaccharide biosynthesis protein n=1 Tax=Nonlabens spongiae TaxID=331648 RepID=A0A1W6MJW3_9FLAO|nr:nucleoside-diphosphate sugar epimerase/dehydratase [Nonlabens spongiae]ARN77759.1 polysaccharide biosynthesis protein [Nonlabens spongiae]
MTWEYFKRRLIFILWNGDSKLRFRNLRYLPRWIVLVFDVFLVSVSSIITYNIINLLTHQFYELLSIEWQIVLTVFVYSLSFLLLSTYSGVVRHSTFVDVAKIAIACLISTVVLAGISYLSYFSTGQKIFLVPFLIINVSITFISMLFFRLTVKMAYQSFSKVNRKRKNVLIFEVSDETIALAEAINGSNEDVFDLVGFISSKKKHTRVKILGKPIFRFDDQFYARINPLKVDAVILPAQVGNKAIQEKLIDFCLENTIKILSSPKIEAWEDTSIDLVSNIRQIQIEDLLDRHQIILDDTLIRKSLSGKNILVTGGAGSIGSEIVRQIAAFKPNKLIVFDQAESPLNEISLELIESYPKVDFQFVLGDIRNSKRVAEIFESNRISIVYHAAAYKHVPLIENNPKEAVDVNIMGTINIADLCVEHGVDRFVMISTDKAVNPTNVMGATKRAAELYVQSLKEIHSNRTDFITTRFGNVLGSNGSVIPHFKKLIEKGGPVTVTHKDIIRYFMTITEACQLVLQAGTMGNGGEIFVFDMGKPVKILNLAEKMIRLSGLEPYKDIEIEFTGLRPGEKLYEELLSNDSETLPTHNEKILIAKQKGYTYNYVLDHLNNVIIAGANDDNEMVVSCLKKLIPEFKSNNSIFESLDRQVR